MSLDTSDYKKGITEAKKEGQDFADETSNKVSPKAVAAWAAIAAAVLAVTKAIAKLAKDSINYADNVSDLAAQYGVATDAISEMQYIAEQSSTSVEGLTSSMKMLYSRAKEDGEVFRQLGISVKDTEGNFKSMDELFWETIGALNDIENDGEKSAVMLDLFGRSAMSIGEVARKSSDEIAQMRQEAHDLGVVMSKETVQAASDFNDTLAVLKLQGQSALASLVAGAPDAEKRLQDFFDNLLEILDGYIPVFVKFGVKLLVQISLELIKISPKLTADVIDAIIDTIFEIDWVQVGWDIGEAILEGMLNIIVSGLNAVLGAFGVKIPKIDFRGSQESDYLSNIDTSEYEISENIRQDINVKVEASGDSTVSKETAEKTAEALAPYIDKILGGK